MAMISVASALSSYCSDALAYSSSETRSPLRVGITDVVRQALELTLSVRLAREEDISLGLGSLGTVRPCIDQK
ncbi:hypothetical protein [Nonomuraea sp. NPDC005501]|uniref:hypothetical protein n=1 Tax=Nonomuraea sp. NPDC005501 TaxID=3156884 RepID=UPI0033B184E4